MLVRERLARIIEDRGVNQATIARRMKEEPYWLNDRLTGRVQIKADELPKIAAALRIDPCELLRDPQSQPQRPAGDRTAPIAIVPDFQPTEADLVMRELAESWDELPERERRFLRGLAQLRRDYQEGDPDDE